MTICGTGHRPNKLGGYGRPVLDRLIAVAHAWLEANRPDVVISGMALGWDQALAVAAIRLKIPTHAYIPCVGQESMWPEKSQKFYHKILERCAFQRTVHPDTFTPVCMQWRNEAMVDAADTVLALWDGSPGGTGNCIRYAKQKKKPIVNLWEAFKP